MGSLGGIEMEAPPPFTSAGTAGKPAPARHDISVSMYVREVASTVCTAFQEFPAVGAVCKTLLSVEMLVRSAKANKDELAILLELCDVVTRGVLNRVTEYSPAYEGIPALRRHVDSARKVAAMCNKGIFARFAMGRKISRSITNVKTNIVNFATINNLALSTSLHTKLGKLEQALAAQERERQKAEEKERLARIKAGSDQSRAATVSTGRAEIPAGAPRVWDWYVERKAVIAEACDLLGVDSSSGNKNSSSSSSISSSSYGPPKDETDDERHQHREQEKMVGLTGPGGAGKSVVASMVVAREDVRSRFHGGVLWLPVGQGARDRLPALMLRLANMVHEIVLAGEGRPPRALAFGLGPEDGVSYIREAVGGDARRCLVVADGVWEAEVLEELRGTGMRVLYTCRAERLLPDPAMLPLPLVRLDEVSTGEAEAVLRRAAGLSGSARLPKPAYELMERCKFSVMDLAYVGRWRGVRGRTDAGAWQCAVDAIVAEARREGEDSRDRDGDGSDGGDDGGRSGKRVLPWRTAVLRAGAGELAAGGAKNEELYVSLAVVPKGLPIGLEDVAALLFDEVALSADNLRAAGGVVAALERRSVLVPAEEGGKYRVSDSHAEFVRERISERPDARERALRRWRGHVSTVRSLLARPGEELAEIWRTVAAVDGDCGGHEGELGRGGSPPAGGGGGDWTRPYDAALDGMDALDGRRPAALRRAGRFHWLSGNPSEASVKWTELLAIAEEKLGAHHLDVADALQSLGECALASGGTSAATGAAEEFYRRALSIRAEKLGADHELVGYTLHCLELCTRREATSAQLGVPTKPVALIVAGVLLVAICGRTFARKG